MSIPEYIIIGLAVVIIVLLIVTLSKLSSMRSGIAHEVEEAIENDLTAQRSELNQRVDSLYTNMNQSLNMGFSRITESDKDNINDLRTVVNERLGQFEQTMSSNNTALDNRMETMRKSQEDKLESMRLMTEQQFRENRETTQSKLDEIISSNRKSLDDVRETTQKNLNELRYSNQKKLDELRESNQKKLDEIQGTVAEKLDKTLSERVNESFKNVSQQLEQVYKGLGEMQNLASDVGSLKNALVNVKVRGEIGEVQLGRILEQMLSSEQYEENVITKKETRDPVEFAVKIPSKDSENKYIWLPIDAKFRLDVYNALIEAYDSGDKDKVDVARKALKDRVKNDAKTISSKYISVPDTTDFAIMFLPTEGLFSEIIRDAALTEQLRNDFKITVCGPSTITAFLNSLQMGFRTLSVEKKSSQIAMTLSAVKSEFSKFGDSLAKVQKNIESTGKELDSLVGTRTRAINRKLRDIDELPESEALKLLPPDEDNE